MRRVMFRVRRLARRVCLTLLVRFPLLIICLRRRLLVLLRVLFLLFLGPLVCRRVIPVLLPVVSSLDRLTPRLYRALLSFLARVPRRVPVLLLLPKILRCRPLALFAVLSLIVLLILMSSCLLWDCPSLMLVLLVRASLLLLRLLLLRPIPVLPWLLLRCRLFPLLLLRVYRVVVRWVLILRRPPVLLPRLLRSFPYRLSRLSRLPLLVLQLRCVVPWVMLRMIPRLVLRRVLICACSGLAKLLVVLRVFRLL